MWPLLRSWCLRRKKKVPFLVTCCSFLTASSSQLQLGSSFPLSAAALHHHHQHHHHHLRTIMSAKAQLQHTTPRRSQRLRAVVTPSDDDDPTAAATSAEQQLEQLRPAGTSGVGRQRKKRAATSSPKRNQKMTVKKRKNGNNGDGEETQEKQQQPRTECFGALYCGNVNPHAATAPAAKAPLVEPHTLILGTHPSVASLSQQQYYGHPMNSFWWIAGDCLGFRRGDAVSPATGKLYKFASELRYGDDAILPYDQQTKRLVDRGFALWDVLKTCERKGSLDQDIKKEVPNEIREFCDRYPSIRRIVLANGGTGSAFFKRHFRDWLQSGNFVVADHDGSRQVFGKIVGGKKKNAAPSDDEPNAAVTALPAAKKNSRHPIILVSAISVSPAAAKYGYEEKRDFWEKYVYRPGLEDYEAMVQEAKAESSPYFR